MQKNLEIQNKLLPMFRVNWYIITIKKMKIVIKNEQKTIKNLGYKITI